MSNNIFFLFQCAFHPETKCVTYPCPLEWKFSEGEHVFVRHDMGTGNTTCIRKWVWLLDWHTQATPYPFHGVTGLQRYASTGILVRWVFIWPHWFTYASQLAHSLGNKHHHDPSLATNVSGGVFDLVLGNYDNDDDPLSFQTWAGGFCFYPRQLTRPLPHLKSLPPPLHHLRHKEGPCLVHCQLPPPLHHLKHEQGVCLVLQWPMTPSLPQTQAHGVVT